MHKMHFFTLLAASSGVALLTACGGSSDGGAASAESASRVVVRNSFQGQAGGLADVNGDGIADLVSCAPYAERGESRGVVFVYPGTASGFASEPAEILSGDDQFGFAFVSLGDVDRDGTPDFAVSALHGDGEGVSLSGSVTVFKGGGNGSAIAKLAGEMALDRFGYALAAGDLNGDGVPDLAIGAPFHSPSPELYQAGAVYLYDFASGDLRPLRATPEASGVGWSLAVGDLDGDGIADLALTSKSAYGVGNKVLIYYGRSDLLVNPGPPDRTLTSMASGFGDSLTVGPDLDGDAKGELLIGAPGATVNGMAETGTLFVVKGGGGNGTVSIDSTPSALVAKISGQGAYDRFGHRAVALEDLDSGGKPDLAVSAVHADCGTYKASGKVYVLSGEQVAAGSASLASAGVVPAPEPDMHFGGYLVPFRRNGQRLLVGAPTADANSGAVYAVDPATAGLLFRVCYGGVTTAHAECCK